MKAVVVDRFGHVHGLRLCAIIAAMVCGGLTEAADPADPKDEDPAVVQRREQIKHQAAHWEQQFMKLLYGDLELIRSLCDDLPRESRRAIARTGEKVAKEAALRVAELQFGGRRPPKPAGNAIERIDPDAGGEDADTTTVDPVSLVSESLRKSLAERAGDETASAFAREIQARAERRRSATVHEIVAVLDTQLFLTEAQRGTIERALLDGWLDRMASATQGIHLVNGRRVFPAVLDDCVRPHLTEPQREQFLIAPRTVGGDRAWHVQAWMRTVNLLNTMQPVERDPWWFQ